MSQVPAVGARTAGVPFPPLVDLLAAAHVVRVPLRVRFRGVNEREVVLLHGPSGWAEWAPFLEYDDADAARWLAAALELGWGSLPGALRDVVGVNATVPAVGPEQVAGVLANYDGCRTVKVKVAERGQSLADDLARVSEVRRLMGPAAALRVDANGAWSLEQAREALGRLAPLQLEYAEQPCAAVEDLAALRVMLARDGIDVPIAADESIRRAADPLRVAKEGAADLVVVKVAPLGGVARALEIVAECGLPAVVSSALDTSVGLAAGVALAAALPGPVRDCGLGTGALLGADVVHHPLVPVAGAITCARATAAREAVDPGLLTAYQAGAQREAWWQERLGRAHALLPTVAGAETVR